MISREKIIAIIPARYASARLPAKPLIDICGKPMIQHVYERAKEATLLSRVIVATDHEGIVSAVEKFGGEVMFTPDTLRSGSDRIAFVAQILPDAEIIVNVQGDEPLIVPQMIDEAIRPLMQDNSIQAGTLVKRISSADELSNPNVVKTVLDINGFCIYFSRAPIPFPRDAQSVNAQNIASLYYKHIGLYVFRRDFLLTFASWEETPLEQTEKLEQLRIIEHGYKIKGTITAFDSIPVDTASDAERVRTIISKGK